MINLLTQKIDLAQKNRYKVMITINENYQNLVESNQNFQLRGFSVSEININGNLKIIFQKGIGITLTKKIIDLYINLIFEKRQGYIKDRIGYLTIFMHFFEKEEDNKLVITYIDKIEKIMSYNELYQFSKYLFRAICSNTSIVNIEQICTRIINIPKALGLVGFFIIDKAGFLYFSKIKINQPKLAKNNFQVAGFISAILIYSQDFIAREEYGLQLEDVDLGGYHMFLKVKNNIIFTYIIDNENHSDNIKRYMQLIMEEFIDKYYYSHVLEFKGDLGPFHSFERIIDQYFEI